jgi:transcriptional regulator with XRE-family HTH domain
MLQKALTDKFTELLKIHREASGLSQTDISEMLRIGLRSYQRYESGESSPSIEVTYLLSRILKFELKELFEIKNPQHIIPGLKIYSPEESDQFKKNDLIEKSKFIDFISSKEFQTILKKGDIKEIKKLDFYNSSDFPLTLSNPKNTILNSKARLLTGFQDEIVQTTLGQDHPNLMGLIWANFLDTGNCFFEQVTYPNFPNGKSKMTVKGFYTNASQNHLVFGVLDIVKIETE